MSTNKLILLGFYSISIIAQSRPSDTFAVSGELHGDNAATWNALEVQLFDEKSHTLIDRTFIQSDGRFQLQNAIAGAYTIRVVRASQQDPILEEIHQFDRVNLPLILELPAQRANRPASGTVSVTDLAHPIPKKALCAAIEAQHYRDAQDEPQAMRKLEEAIRIDPDFRDAYINLGALYARAGRLQDALTQFQRAMKIGPPNSFVYSNMSWAYLALKRPRDADEFARKALSLDPSNSKARSLLDAITKMYR